MIKSNIRILKRYAYFPSWVWIDEDGEKSKWIWLRSFNEKQEYLSWNDFQEGVGDHWITNWRCLRQYI